jgi:aarF domain-containing kinase
MRTNFSKVSNFMHILYGILKNLPSHIAISILILILLGSPVNRINIMANYASKSIFLINSSSYKAQLKSQINYLKFRTILFMGTLGFYITRLIYFVKIWLGMKDYGMEGLLDEQLKQTLQQNFPGIVIDDSLFES